MNIKLLIYRVLFIIFAIILFIIHRLCFYYTILDENNSSKYDELLSIYNYIDIYNANIEEFENEPGNYAGTKLEYNSKTKDKQIKNPMQAVKTTKNFLNIVENDFKMKEPCFVTYNSNANVWIVQENVYKFRGCGGEFIAVFNAENSDIVYTTHFQ